MLLTQYQACARDRNVWTVPSGRSVFILGEAMRLSDAHAGVWPLLYAASIRSLLSADAMMDPGQKEL